MLAVQLNRLIHVAVVQDGAIITGKDHQRVFG